MWEVAERFRVRIGGNTYINTPNLVCHKGKPLFSLRRHEDGYLGIDFEIYDHKGTRVATVRRNEIYEGDKDSYAIDGSLNRYVLTERATGDVICDIRKRDDAENSELEITELRLYTPSGFRFIADPNKMNLAGMTFFGCTFADSDVGINIG